MIKPFNPNGASYLARYGVDVGGVAGFGDGSLPHGGATDFLPALFTNPTFLSARPEYNGVIVPVENGALAIGAQTDLSFAYSQSLGGAWRYLLNAADLLGFIPKGTVAPTPGRPDDGPHTLPPIVPVGPPVQGSGSQPTTDPRAALVAALAAYLAVAQPAEAATLQPLLDAVTSGKPIDLGTLAIAELPKLLSGRNAQEVAFLTPVLQALISGQSIDWRTLLIELLPLLLSK